jgi:hypothetical protein
LPSFQVNENRFRGTSGKHDFAIFGYICKYSSIYANIASIALRALRDIQRQVPFSIELYMTYIVIYMHL